ncbi:hypothetical protein HY995_05275 [Candidatus Micrarchaeota archaeon]|nr:hypothetical protein [Candidatus Micrarchaeota archaeon]MBI5177466.1 hypothetical protein [Candidatus Micrarchaeota archaeon]
MRGFALTVDALLSVSFVLLAISAMAMMSQAGPEDAVAAQQDALARDYLALKYGNQIPLTPADFLNLTTKTLDENAPGGGADWFKAEYLHYPPILGCRGACSFLNASTQADFLKGPDFANAKVRKEAWIRK